MSQLISVIIPVYNTERYLCKCLDSIVNQTYKNLQIILVDDGSTDDSGKICDAYATRDSRIIVIHKKNSGVSEARNMGIETASGDYFSFVDSDDWLELNTYQRLADIAKTGKVDVMIFDYYVTYPSREIQHQTASCFLGNISRETAFQVTLSSVNPFLYTKMYHKRCAEGVRFRTDIHWGEDTMFAFSAIEKAASVYYTPESFYHYVQSENSATRSVKFNPRRLSGIPMCEFFIDACKTRHPQLLGYAYAKQVGILTSLIYDLYMMKDVKKKRRIDIRFKAFKVLLRGIRYPQISRREWAKLLLAVVIPRLYCSIHENTIRKYKKQAEAANI